DRPTVGLRAGHAGQEIDQYARPRGEDRDQQDCQEFGDIGLARPGRTLRVAERDGGPSEQDGCQEDQEKAESRLSHHDLPPQKKRETTASRRDTPTQVEAEICVTGNSDSRTDRSAHREAAERSISMKEDDRARYG